MPFNSDPMYRAKALMEGMWAGDLNDLLSSEISIDEYESKVDDNAIVIGFFVHDIDAASDLNRFLQKSTVDLLYSEVSPAPDQRGYYIVFVEILDNTKLAANICELVEEVTYLTNVEQWTAIVFGVEKPIKISEETLEEALKTARTADKNQKGKTDKEREVKLTTRVSDLRKKLAAAQKRLSESSLDNIAISNGGLTLTSRNRSTDYELEYFGSLSALDIGALSVDFTSLKECRDFSLNLGEGWDVAKAGKSFVLHMIENDIAMVIRPQE